MNGRVGAALITFGLGVVLTLVVVRVWRIPDMEQPPCSSCALLYRQEIPTVSICDLTNNFEHYRGRRVRVRGLFAHDAGQVNLFDEASSCGLHTGFADSCELCNGTARALFVYSGFGSWYDSAARVEVVGHVGSLENPTIFADDRGFNIDCLERVEPVGTGIPERVKYTLGYLFRKFFN